jgi:uncharacterized membrane protein YdcZ (DUF606 family)
MIKYWSLIFIGVGLAILLIGDTVASFGQKIDNLIASKWTGIVLLIVGGVLFIGSESKIKLDRSL